MLAWWNDALGYHPLSLICGYSERTIRGSFSHAPVETISSAHGRVIPALAEA